MNQPVETFEKNGVKAEIFMEDYLEDPRKQWDHLGKMVCWHRRHNLGDEQPRTSGSEWIKQLAAEKVNGDSDLIPDKHIVRILEKHFIILPLFLYEHSGMSMRTGSFSDPWDSGQVGYIYMSMEAARKEWTDEKDPVELVKKATALLEVEVKEYDQFLRGDVYFVSVSKEDKCDHGTDHREVLESCGGFYGFDYAKEEARRMLDESTKEAVGA